MPYQSPRGTADILPVDQHYWRYIEEKAVRICELYGYSRIDSPTFEDTGLFVRGVGQGTDIVEKEMYTFADKGGNSITLRPEGTAPVCRAYLEHSMQNVSQPVKLFYFASVFRYERPQAGRLREHHQFGCEAIGEADPALDAEVIEMSWRFFQSLCLSNISLQINSIGCPVCRPEYLKELRGYYSSHLEELCPDCKGRFERSALRLLDCKQRQCQPLAAAAPKGAEKLCPECAVHFDRVKECLTALGIPFQINHRLVRGLDYYSKTVFEIQPLEEAGQSTIGAGGRYDHLIEELGGKHTPAIGFATGIERIILNLKKLAVPVPELPGPVVYVAHTGEYAVEVLKIASELRTSGIRALAAASSKSLKAQLRQANSSGYGFGAGYILLQCSAEGKVLRIYLIQIFEVRRQAQALVANIARAHYNRTGKFALHPDGPVLNIGSGALPPARVIDGLIVADSGAEGFDRGKRKRPVPRSVARRDSGVLRDCGVVPGRAIKEVGFDASLAQIIGASQTKYNSITTPNHGLVIEGIGKTKPGREVFPVNIRDGGLAGTELTLAWLAQGSQAAARLWVGNGWIEERNAVGVFSVRDEYVIAQTQVQGQFTT